MRSAHACDTLVLGNSGLQGCFYMTRDEFRICLFVPNNLFKVIVYHLTIVPQYRKKKHNNLLNNAVKKYKFVNRLKMG